MSSSRIYFNFLLLHLSNIMSYHHFAETQNKQDNKPRRAYYAGRITSLYPFPRSGRSDPDFHELDRLAHMSATNSDNNDKIHEGRKCQEWKIFFLIYLSKNAFCP